MDMLKALKAQVAGHHRKTFPPKQTTNHFAQLFQCCWSQLGCINQSLL